MLGKLKRTLTRDLSKQRRTSNDKGAYHSLTTRQCRVQHLIMSLLHVDADSCYFHLCNTGYISAAIPGNPDRNGPPNLLRPSPGLDFLAEKTALSDGAAERWALLSGLVYASTELCLPGAE